MPTPENKPLAGKVALVTGSTTGLGLRIYRQLAELGASVYVAGRNEAAGRAAAAEFHNARFVRMDLSTVRSAQEAARVVLALGLERLDILVNNAAILVAQEYALNEDGVVVHMGVNHFGHFVLTNALLPLLKKTAWLPGAEVRIITLGSTAYKAARKNRRFDSVDAINADLQGEDIVAKMHRYGVAKLAQCLWARELAHRVKDAGISSIVVNPGPTSTGTRPPLPPRNADSAHAQRVQGEGVLPLPIRWLSRLVTRAPEDAARSTVWAATVPEPLAKWSGRCVARSKITGSIGAEAWVDLMADGKWEPLAKELWETSERVVEAAGQQEN